MPRATSIRAPAASWSGQAGRHVEPVPMHHSEDASTSGGQGPATRRAEQAAGCG